MAVNVVRRDAEKALAGISDEPKVTLTLRVKKKTAWGARMYAKGREKDLSDLIEPLIVEMIRGKRIPWAWFEELTGTEPVETPSQAAAEARENPPVEALPVAEILPTPEAETPAPKPGRGEQRRKTGREVLEKIAFRSAG
jgi:hypothetical protein